MEEAPNRIECLILTPRALPAALRMVVFEQVVLQEELSALQHQTVPPLTILHPCARFSGGVCALFTEQREKDKPGYKPDPLFHAAGPADGRRQGALRGRRGGRRVRSARSVYHCRTGKTGNLPAGKVGSVRLDDHSQGFYRPTHPGRSPSLRNYRSPQQRGNWSGIPSDAVVTSVLPAERADKRFGPSKAFSPRW